LKPSKKQIKVLIVGFGPLGRQIYSDLKKKDNIEVVGVADISPEISGKDCGDLCGIGVKTGITVRANIDFEKKSADAAIITSVSDVKSIYSQIEKVANLGINIISTCEELTYPWINSPELSQKINSMAKNNSIFVLSTGVNPGFLMDFLPLVMTGVCKNIESIGIKRYQNAIHRRLPFQKKIGAWLAKDEFERKKNAGTLRHVGLLESIQMIAAGLGWRLDRVEEEILPVLADIDMEIGDRNVKKGTALGVRQLAKGYLAEKMVLSLDFKASVNEKETFDSIDIKGLQDISLKVKGGINGDVATCAIVVNALNLVGKVNPGLKTMIDIPVITCM